MLLELKVQLKNHLCQKPIRPKRMNLLARDITPEAIAWRLHNESPSVGLMSDEAGQILNGRAASQLPMLNELWGGGELIVDRRESVSFTVNGARLTVSLMLQEKTFTKFLSTKGEMARDNGFLSRNLITCPPSTQGLRENWSIEEAKWSKLQEFQTRIAEILSLFLKSANEPGFKRTMLKFSPDAKVLWMNFANHIERNLNPGGMYCDVRDAASKIAENVARMATLFHFFEGRSGDIQSDSVNQALQICEWYLGEFKRIFAPAPPIPQQELDAMTLDAWLRTNFAIRGQYCIRRNALLQMGHGSIRNKARLDPAISILAQFGRIRLTQEPKSRTWWVELLVLSPPYHFQMG